MLVDQTGPPGKDYYDRFLASLPAKEPRYGVLDFQIETAEGALSKTLFYAWYDNAKIFFCNMLNAP